MDMVDAIAVRVAELLGEREHRAPLDAAGAARYLGLLKPDGTPRADWVLNEARCERIPYVQLGKFKQFRPDDLDAWLDGRVQGPRPRKTAS
jgi:hypothetical protein